ncbi:MAG: hypothetical protein ETSY1_13320 [Candidatus Entotheonella factor]|uniref:Uncharacterized protein n=1 Tax=Entotheonella factor TaxID=1429438 RepID=W4LP70_ENTF1|nr:hypothetical protein [Candidatus Entotheonella palauensis]ETW99853.1 MAG: hypothetical protein ETSY1_13320 [Candidatus Entotheonella factor]
MQEPKPITDPSELLHHIRRLSHEADWDTEELDDALRESGVDPDRLVSRVMADIGRHLRAGDAAPRPAARPLLIALRDSTRLPSSAIAEALDVPVPFLSMVSRHPKAVPEKWRQELARRAEQRLEIDPESVLQSFSAAFQFDRAAMRETSYTADAVQHYDDILERSGMTPDMRQFWQNLAGDA